MIGFQRIIPKRLFGKGKIMVALQGYQTALEKFSKTANISSLKQYEEMYNSSINDPEQFWADWAKELLVWEKQWEEVVSSNFETGAISWFKGGVLSPCYNLLDRWLETRGNQPAIYWMSKDLKDTETVTYQVLHKKVNKFSALLKSRGVEKGDRVVIYLPNLVDSVVALLSCARIGAIHCNVYFGYSLQALCYRIDDCSAKVLITSESCVDNNSGQIKAGIAAEVATACRAIETIILVDEQIDSKLEQDEKIVWLREAIEDSALQDYIACEPMDSEDPLFIIYTGLPTSKPKGLTHTVGGYLLYSAMTTRFIHDAQDGDILWHGDDISSIAGHTYSVYGPMALGLSSVIFQGSIRDKGLSATLEVISRFKVSVFSLAPSSVRSMMVSVHRGRHKHLESRWGRFGGGDGLPIQSNRAQNLLAPGGLLPMMEGDNELLNSYDLSTLKLLALTDQNSDDEVNQWVFNELGRRECPVINPFCISEGGGYTFFSIPAVDLSGPESCGRPFFGVEPVILNPDTGKQAKHPDEEGALCFQAPWPGMAQTFFNDHERFVESYFLRAPNYFFAGDGARQDRDGLYHVVGRIDDVINVNGHRIGIPELEYALFEHELVDDAAIVGIPHQKKGVVVYAFVELDERATPGDSLILELNQKIEQTIGSFVKLDAVQWTDVLPRTPTGKLLRLLLQRIALGKVEDLGEAAGLTDKGTLEDLIRGRKDINI